MPIHDIKCGYCNFEYEAVLFRSDSEPQCPSCCAIEKQKKIISAPKVISIQQNDYPTNNNDLSNYMGNGKYAPGYKK